MNLNELVPKLQALLPKLKASDADFASGLIKSYKKYGSLTPKQAPWIEKLIARAETPAFQVTASYAPKPYPVVKPEIDTANVGDFSGVTSLFNVAKQHLKFPKVRLVVKTPSGYEVKIILSLKGEKSKLPGFVSIVTDAKTKSLSRYLGHVSPVGVFTPSHTAITLDNGELIHSLVELLSEFAANPARVAKNHGKLTGHCCFCGKELGLGKEKRSVYVGFGPDCAEHYGLKDKWLKAADKIVNVTLHSANEEFGKSGVATKEITPAYPGKTGVGSSWSDVEASLKDKILDHGLGLFSLQDPKVTVAGNPKVTISYADLAAFYKKQIEYKQGGEPTVTVGVDVGAEEIYEPSAHACPSCGAVQDCTPDCPIGGDDAHVDAVLTALNAPTTECYFCAKPSYADEAIDGFAVCAECAKQLA